MFFHIYVSIAKAPFTDQELIDLLEHSRANNEKVGVTGMLLYKDGNFMQVLEGEEHAVRTLTEKIGRDPRHHKMIMLLEGSAESREFAGWWMGFNNLETPEASVLSGYSEFMNTPLTAGDFTESPTRAQRLLRIFRRT